MKKLSAALALLLTLTWGPPSFAAPGAALVAPSPTPATGHCAQWSDVNVLTDSGAACGGGGGGGSGTVTSITAGSGLTGGTITTSGTIALSATVPRTNAVNTFTSSQILSASNATTPTSYLSFTPTNYGTGNPQLFIQKTATANKWAFGTYDTASSAGQIDFQTTSLTFNGTPLVGAGTANNFLATQTIIAGTSTGGNVFLAMQPSDYGVGKPALSFQKSTTANEWILGMFDGASYNGTLNLSAQNTKMLGSAQVTGNLTVNGTITTTGGCTGCGGGGGGSGLPTIYDATQYGADPTNSADNVTAFNSVASACSTTGGVIFFPAGTYRFNSSISLTAAGCSIAGAGTAATHFNINFAGNFLTVNQYFTGISDLEFVSAGAHSSGYALVINGASYARPHNLSFTGVYNGGYVTNASETIWDNINITNNVGAVGIDCETNTYGARFNHILMNSGSNTGTKGIVQGSGCFSIDVFQSYFGATAQCLYVGAGSYFTTTEELACDHNQDGVVLDGGGGVQISNSWFGSALAGRGITFTANFGGEADLVNNSIRCNYYDGVLINGGLDISMSNNSIGCNSQASFGTYSGIAVGANVRNFTITGNRIGAVSPQTSPATQAYCVIVNSGSSDHYIIANNNCQGQVTGTVADGGSGSNKSITGNVG